MPKMKTHQGTAKRIKVTGSRRILRRQRVFGARTKSNHSTLRDARKPSPVQAKRERRLIRKLVPGIKI